MQRKQMRHPAAVIAAIQTLVKLAETHGIDAVNHVYAETIAEVMATETRETWRARISETQKELAFLDAH